jgi:short subunit dehydrogenase-like uncharacterized protein
MSYDRDLDIVVFGATGFAGRLVARYLADHGPSGVRIGLAGRSQERLEGVRATLGTAAASWPLLVAESTDPASLAALANLSRVVATTVGPYGRYGLPLVEACAAAGTHYADLTGEVLFMHDSIERYHDLAASTGARIVHACGFDSIPSDLGVLLLHEALAGGEHPSGAARASRPELEDTTLVVTAMKGAPSGGTLATLELMLDEARRSRQRRRIMADPYALSPDRAAEPRLGSERDLSGIEHDSELGMWLGPFAMAAANTRVVRRSNALRGWAYGRRFRYREVSGFGQGLAAPVKAGVTSAGLLALVTGLGFGPSRALLHLVLPAPGEGPGEDSRRKGYFRMQVHTRTSTGARYRCTIAAEGDPGYAATAVMLGESALCLALDRDRLPDRAGVLTPATAMGTVLADRLRAAGQTLAVEQISTG